MKNTLNHLKISVLIILVLATLVNSCKKEEKCPDVDYTSIDQVISDAQQKNDTAVEGTLPGQYPSPAKKEFQEAIDVANAVRTKDCVTQQELDTAENVLKTAGIEFESNRIPDCPEVDYTQIDQSIVNAQQIHDDAMEGTEPGDYLPGSKGALQQVIDHAQFVRSKDCVSQDELNTATSMLIDALVTFESKIIQEVDYSLIDQTIADAQQIHDNAVEGSEPGEYLPGSKAELQQAIDAAQSVRDKVGVTQFELTTAVATLENALEVFESKKIIDLSANLVAHWLFNGNGTDASGNGHNGTASAGHANWGGGMPQLATDRFGNLDYCYKFVDGGNFVVENGPAFIPAKMTISAWMNLYDTWAHSYFFSNDIWNTYKFQVQDANKPFFTAHIMKDDGSGEEAWIDKDSSLDDLDLDTWYQVVLTYESGKMTFWINGLKVQEWSDFPTGTLIPPNPAIDICIGQALPTSAYTDIEGDPYQWQEWLGYFKGYIDDMRFYDVILTDTQIESLYDYEKATTIE